jgi:hypothetical protein
MNNQMSNAKPDLNPSYEREQALFILAAAKPLAERVAFLDRECGADKVLRTRLEALLAAHERPEPVMDAAVGRVKATMELEPCHPPDETIGQKIGRYKMLEKVGAEWCTSRNRPHRCAAASRSR